MKIFNIPIESLEERYSEQWNEWFPAEFDRLKIDYETIYPEPLSNKIENGSFLDIIGTNYFKSMQLAEISKLLNEGKVKDGDIFFFHDLWFPGIEQLFYMRDATGIQFKITGMLHAGTWDVHDFLFKKGMARWARNIEGAWLSEFDIVFVATKFHKSLIQKVLYNNYPTAPNIHVTGFPLNIPVLKDYSKKENIIVFPHRMDDEKNPESFKHMAKYFKKDYPDWKFLFTKEECKNKKEYYDLLKRAKVAVSFARQETWGIAQQEAMYMGCIPVVPNRLSYAEMYSPDFKFRSVKELPSMIANFVLHYESWIEDASFQNNLKTLKNKNDTSISRMYLKLFELVL